MSEQFNNNISDEPPNNLASIQSGCCDKEKNFDKNEPVLAIVVKTV